MGISLLGYKIHYTVGQPVTAASELPVALTGDYFVVSGTTTIASIKSMGKGMQILLEFEEVLTLTHSSSLILPSGEDFVTSDGDVLRFVETSLGVWECVEIGGSGGGSWKDAYITLDTHGNTCLGKGIFDDLLVPTGANNTALGENALLNIYNGYGNTAIGREALKFTDDGTDNVAIGYQAGSYDNNSDPVTTLTSGIFIGRGASPYADDSLNEIVIGPNTVGHGDGTATIGSSGTMYLMGPVTLDAGQLKFPATQSASADVNTLDDYEEGSFTPTLSFSTTTDCSYAKQYGKYVKVGDTVHIIIDLKLSSLGTSAGTVQLDGLPFTTADNSVYGTMAVFFENIAFTGAPGVYINPNGSYARIGEMTSGGGVDRFTTAEMEDDAVIRLNGHYRV